MSIIQSGATNKFDISEFLKLVVVSPCRTYSRDQIYTRRNQQLKWRIFTLFTVKREEIEYQQVRYFRIF